MSVPEQTPYKEYTGNGVTKNFALEFTCDSKQELKVFIDNVESELSTWSLVGGSVVFTTAPASGSKIVLKRATKLERTTNYSSINNSFRPEAINKDLDRIWYAIQEQNYKVGQYDYDYNFVLTQVRPIATGGTGANNPNDARNNLNTYSKEEVNALIATGGEGNVVGIAGGGTGGTTAAEARTNLGVPSTVEVAEAIDSATPPDATTTVKGVAKIATSTIVQAGTNDTDFITPKKLLDFIKTNVIKSNFVDVKANRTIGVTYTNPSTSQYLNVRINATVPNGGSVSAYMSDKLVMSSIISGGSSWGEYIFLLVPPLATYRLAGAASIQYWGEA